MSESSTSLDNATVAVRAAESVLGVAVGPATLISAGRSCEAFVVESAGPDAQHWVVRVPVPGTDRSIRFHAEAAIGALLKAEGHPVAAWDVVDVVGITCAVGERLVGAPLSYGSPWAPAFSARLGDLLADLHQLPASGFGPLVDDATHLRGETSTAVDGARRRWCWATCWPFDGSDLVEHPAARLIPEAMPDVERRRQQYLDAADGPVGVLHSDLHREHLLAGPAGALTGVLDFGDAFVGSVAWDFAQLHWYYDPEVSAAVARRHSNGPGIDASGRLLAEALGLYKVAKVPIEAHVQRLQRILARRTGR